MKYNPELECKIFLGIKELGETSLEELLDYMKKHEKLEIDKKDIKRYVGRWKAKKVVAVTFKDGVTLYRMADIPAWYSSGVMAIVKGSVNEDMKTAIEGLNERLKKQGRIIQPRGVYGNYVSYKMTFESIDSILGGWISETEGELQFPRKNGEMFIPANWFYGWIRDNSALINLPKSICYHIGFSNGKFNNKPKTEKIQLKVKIGLATYEALPEKTKFETIMRFPFKGTTLKTEKQVKDFFKQLEICPLRGFGANSRALGGKIKLVSMETI